MATFAVSLLNLVVILISLFLIGLVLIQRGKGGGLAGAFGGVGGSSPFGSKAGDAFTRITVWVAAVWVLAIILQVKFAPNATPGGGGGNLPGVTKSGG